MIFYISKHIMLVSFLLMLMMGSLFASAEKSATDFTKKINLQHAHQLPINQQEDVISAQRGFIATLDGGLIYNDKKDVVYDINQYSFITGKAPDTVHPGLWRQSQLNQKNGLFKVTEGIYQVRNFDLANMTFVRSKTGWIVIDPLLSPATAKAAKKLVDEKLGKLPVSAVLITHSHVDHFGGIRGIVSEQDYQSGKIPIYAPEGFFEHAISENVMAGNAMLRRASYMFGNLLDKNAQGTVGSGLGQTVSSGEPSVLPPMHSISASEGESKIIDGLEVEFIYTPESEAPAEMVFYFPKYRALCQAEIINRTFHNLYTLRGAKVRNGQKWSEYIDLVIQKWGKKTDISFGTHHWPTWGKEKIVDFWRKQRDLYRFVHDQTMRLANKGMTPKEIAEVLTLPKSLSQEFYNRDYYGALSHNIKAQYQLYFGWFDGNPANLNPLPATEVGKKYVALAGGANALLDKAQAAFDKGEYRWVAELVNHLVFAEPNNKSARKLLADTYEQLGYVAESGPWRNFYLSGAKELRYGVQEKQMPKGFSPDMMRGLPTKDLFNYMAMSFKGSEEKAAKMQYRFNFILPDTQEKLALLVSNGVVNPRMNQQVDDATATIRINRNDLNALSLGEVSVLRLVLTGKLKVQGDYLDLAAFFMQIEKFEPWFNIVTP